MTMIRKVMPALITTVGEDVVNVVISTGNRARDDHIFEPGGAQIENYLKNPVVLWNHDPDLPPVGRGEDVQVNGENITSRVRFAPIGISVRADEIRGLVKAGFINGVSVGIDPIEAEPIDAKKPRGGQRVRQWELIEFSFCNIPVDTGATVTARNQRAAHWMTAASRTLPLAQDAVWNGAQATQSIFQWAGGEHFDPMRARKAFLIYNAAKPKERASYLMPLARAEGGRLMVARGAIEAAAAYLAQSDLPESLKTSARAIIHHYQEQAGMNHSEDPSVLKVRHTRALERAPAIPTFKRGLYEVGQLAFMLQQLGYCHDAAEYESAIEGDASPVPAMLGEALVKFGEALIAMTQEEVTELLEEVSEGEDDEGGEIETRDLSDAGRAYIAAATTPRTRTWRRAITVARAGKSLAPTTEKKIAEANGHTERAMKHHRALGDHAQAVGTHLTAARDLHGKTAKASATAAEALQTAADNPTEPGDHVKRAAKALRAMDEYLVDMGDTLAQADDVAQDVGDAHNSLGRSVKSVQRCLRSVVDGASPEGEDSDSKTVQKSAGTTEDKGSSRSVDPEYVRRQSELSELAALIH